MACGVSSGAGRQHRVADTGEVFGAFEHAVHDAAVIMDRAVAGGAEAVDAAHRAKACVRCGAAGLAQIPFDDTEDDVQHGAAGLGLRKWTTTIPSVRDLATSLRQRCRRSISLPITHTDAALSLERKHKIPDPLQINPECFAAGEAIVLAV
jgi:hypothetical protein